MLDMLNVYFSTLGPRAWVCCGLHVLDSLIVHLLGCSQTQSTELLAQVLAATSQQSLAPGNCSAELGVAKTF